MRRGWDDEKEGYLGIKHNHIYVEPELSSELCEGDTWKSILFSANNDGIGFNHTGFSKTISEFCGHSLLLLLFSLSRLKTNTTYCTFPIAMRCTGTSNKTRKKRDHFSIFHRECLTLSGEHFQHTTVHGQVQTRSSLRLL